MQRRKFLGLFGAAVTAPFVPAPAFAAAVQKVTYSPAAMHAAIYYAQSRAVFSVWGLSKAANLNVAQAELLMGDLAKRGVLGPLQGTTYGGRWATSKVLLSDKLALTKARRLAREKKLTVEANQKRFTQPDLSKLIAHLRGICLDNGMTLHPRCAA